MKNGQNNIKTPVTQSDIYAYERGWAEEMVKIWKEKIMHYRIRHTGALYNSVQATSFGGSSRTIAHKFLLYGLYQETGTGNGYYHAIPEISTSWTQNTERSIIWANRDSDVHGSTGSIMLPS